MSSIHAYEMQRMMRSGCDAARSSRSLPISAVPYRLEACATAHLGSWLLRFHEARLMPPNYVKAYVRPDGAYSVIHPRVVD